MVILDFEGCDSAERGDESEKTAKKLACFAYANSDILILNIMT